MLFDLLYVQTLATQLEEFFVVAHDSRGFSNQIIYHFLHLLTLICWLHNGLSKKQKRSLELLVGKIQEQLDRMPNIILRKHPSNKKRQLIWGAKLIKGKYFVQATILEK